MNLVLIIAIEPNIKRNINNKMLEMDSIMVIKKRSIEKENDELDSIQFNSHKQSQIQITKMAKDEN